MKHFQFARSPLSHKSAIIGTLLLVAVSVSILLPVGQAQAATPAFVQVAFATPQSNQSTVAATYAQAQVAGDTNIIAVGWNDATSNITTLTDTKGNAYQLAVPVVRGASESQAIYYAKNIVAAAANANAVTVKFSAAARYVDLRISEYSGLDATNPFDKGASAFGSSNAATTPSVTTTASTELVFGAGVTSGMFNSAGTGFTTRIITSPDGDISFDKTVSAMGSYNAMANQSGNWVLQVATFRAAGAVADSTAPSVPTGLSATAVSQTQINLAWTASTDNVGVTSYKIFRGGTQIGTSSSVSYQNTGLTAGTNYSYTVAASDAAGNTSAQSTPASATTPAPDTTPPSVPANLMATAASPTQVNLSWSASTDNVGVTGYRVYRDGTQVATSATTTYQNTGLSPGTTYSYTVSAIDASGNESARSTAAPATTPAPDTTPPSIPAGLTATAASSSQINLAWSASTDSVGVTGYRVFRDGAQGATTTATTFSDTGLGQGTTHSYTVAAFDAAGNVSSQSAPASATTLAGPAFAFPAGVSANKRYLVDQVGNPWMMVGDSSQCLSGNLSLADMDYFITNRANHGFNALWIDLVCTDYTGGRPDYSTYDGIKPFTDINNVSTVNEAFFARIDQMVQMAADHGITMVLDPAETGSFLPHLASSGVTNCFNYGAFLGTRYKNFPNIIWMSGNDYQPPWTRDQYVQAVAKGIRSTDPNRVQTIEQNFETSDSFSNSAWIPLINLNASYTYFPTYDQDLIAYNESTVMPYFLVEANYEGENNVGGPPTTDETLRRQEYWTMTSGATGQLYGHHLTWGFQYGPWKPYIDTPAVDQMMYMKNFFAGRAWQNLVPDQSHTFVTAGYGTYYYSPTAQDVLDSDYATAAITPDGTLGVAYIPTGPRTVTVDLGKFSGPVTARWYDPSNNSYQVLSGSPFPRTGLTQLTTPGRNSTGQSDWVLVMEADAVLDTTAPTIPTNLVLGTVNNSQISFSWTASTDNVGVSGYKVYRDGTLVGSTPQTAYSDGGLSRNTTYSYTVAAYDSAGNTSPLSSPLSATTANTVTLGVPTFVQVNAATPQTSQTTVAVNYNQAQVSGNTNIIAVGWNDAVSNIVSLTDGRGNTYQLAAPVTRSSSESQAIYYAASIVAASPGNVVTVVFDRPATHVDLRITEYSGLDQLSPFDKSASATGSASVATTPAVTTTKPSELIFAAGMTTGTYSSSGTGFTTRIITNPDADIVFDRSVTATGSYTATANQYGSWVQQVVTFKAAGQ